LSYLQLSLLRRQTTDSETTDSTDWSVVWPSVVCCLLSALAACTPPIRQFDLDNQALTCEQANDYSLRTLQAMGFTVTAFQPAAVGRAGRLRGTREERGTQNVTVEVTCSGTSVDIDASEDGKLLGQLEFKRGFYLSFTGIAQAAAVTEAEQRAAALRPAAERQGTGLRVLIEPVRGQAARLDFDVDLAAAGVLPVRVTITNGTSRTYRFDPADIVLVQKDGTRVHPLSLDDTAQRVVTAPRAADAAAPDSRVLTQQLLEHALDGDTIAAAQSLKGYLFFPLGRYVKGRVSFEDQATEENEGFVVEF
jgi:hypothetical protein